MGEAGEPAIVIGKKRGGMICKAKGGYAEGGMRSESTESAKSGRERIDASREQHKAEKNYANAQGYGAKNITRADLKDAENRYKEAEDRDRKVSRQTAHPFAGFSKELGDLDLAEFEKIMTPITALVK